MISSPSSSPIAMDEIPLGNGKSKTIKNSIYFASNPIILRYRLRFILRPQLMHRLSFHFIDATGERVMPASLPPPPLQQCRNAILMHIIGKSITNKFHLGAMQLCVCVCVQKHQSRTLPFEHHTDALHCCSCYAIFPI